MDGWSALILAGGAGRRFGGGKLLADLAGAPVIRRVAERVAAGDFAEVLAVTGADDAGVRRALAGLPVQVLHAPDWAEGMSATLRAGIAALAPDASGVCVFLGDMPMVPVSLCTDLSRRAAQTGYAARPRVAGKPGHPVAFTRAAFADLLALEGDSGATALLRHCPDKVAYCDTTECGAGFDIDTPTDLAEAARRWNA